MRPAALFASALLVSGGLLVFRQRRARPVQPPLVAAAALTRPKDLPPEQNH